MQRSKKIIVGFSLCFIGLVVLFIGFVSPRYAVPIIMYHQVAYQSTEPLNTVSPENFEKHMAYLKGHGYKVVSLKEYIENKDRTKFGSKLVVLTFDDGFENNYTYAYPILKKYGFPATMFVITNFINKPGFLKEEEIREMLSSGLIEIASHTQNHSYLPQIKDDARLWSEIHDSKIDLENRLGIKVDFISYPIGGFDENIKGLVKKSGYQAALTTNRGYDKLAKDLYELKRVRLNNKDYDQSLFMKLSGFYNSFKSPKSPY